MPRKPPSPYDHHWRRVRKEILIRAQYKCYVPGCTTPATEIDHIVPISEGGARLDRSNLRPSCVSHNRARSPKRQAALAAMDRRYAEPRQW